MGIPQLLISMLLFLILFFGIGFILNMLLRSTWVMAIVYPIIVIFIVDKVRFIDYFRDTKASFQSLITQLTSLGMADIVILSMGFIGSVIAGVAIRMLRNRGYRMF